MNTGFPDELVIARYEDKSVALERKESQAPVAEAFEEIFKRYHSMVFSLTIRILGDREEALDVSQEVFFSVFRKLHRFRGESSLKTWIYRIAINRASNRCRWWNRLRRRGTVSLDEHLSNDDSRTLSESLESAGNTPEEALLLQEKRLEIERSLQGLPVQQRVAVIMRDVEGLSYEEIAELLRISLGTVKSRIARGREELKRRLNGTLG
ncbi:MAG: sigma-70 family RNA polymerase sigma factor [Acidobacteriia bacterium]|nr:sigma-70 family RNA polymerase sigma factor [Terriglobia bacterium]